MKVEVDPGLEASLRFVLAERVGKVPLGRIQREFGIAASAYEQGAEALAGLLSPAVLEAVFGEPARDQVRTELERAELLGVTFLWDGGPGYPPLLAETEGRPPVLYVRGDPAALLHEPSAAIVGTRRATGAGCAFARRLATELATAGVLIGSGLAMGIDAAAHEGALDGAPGSTFAVLGTGVDRITPRCNDRIGRRILDEGGAIISEFPIGCPGRKSSFPRRNRVISGLCAGVIVVEAPTRSGALATANRALDQGREVMAVPGPVGSRCSEGSNALIRGGAQLVASAADVLESMGLVRVPEPTTENEASHERDPLLRAIDSESTSLDTLATSLNQPPEALLERLTELELDGLITRSGPGWIRIS